MICNEYKSLEQRGMKKGGEAVDFGGRVLFWLAGHDGVSDGVEAGRGLIWGEPGCGPEMASEVESGI